MSSILATQFFERAALLGDHVAVRFKEGKGAYQSMSWTQYGQLVKQMTYGLAALGIKENSCVAIYSNNSHIWIAADLGTVCNGGRSVPIYPTSSTSDIQFIIQNSEAEVVFVQNEAMLRKIAGISDQLPNMRHIVVMELAAGKSLSDAIETSHPVSQHCRLLTVADLLTEGSQLAGTQPALFDERLAKVKPGDVATIIYTSGTTGTPKGAILTHSNLMAVIDDIQMTLPISEEDVYLSYLPLSHVFERVCGEFYWMSHGGEIAFAESIETMAKNLGEINPTMMLVVPRVLDRIYAKVRSGIEGASGNARKLIDWSLEVGKEMVQCKSDARKPSAILKAKHFIAEKAVFKKMRSRIGYRLRLVVSGGAPATAQTIEFFNSIGIETLEGYGLTETSAPATVNHIGRVKVGSVGPCLPSVNIKLADDGEILLRGPSIFKEYFQAEAATKEAFVDGWFKTGDIGTVDGDGYVRITDRKKDLIVNSAGKNIAPQRIEAILKTVPFVNQAVVFGDKQKSLVSLLTLDESAIMEFVRERNWDCQAYSEAIKHGELNQYLRKEIQARSSTLAEYEVVKRFAILPEDLSVDGGELTATLKIKRNVIANKYTPVIEALYRDGPVDAAALTAGKQVSVPR